MTTQSDREKADAYFKRIKKDYPKDFSDKNATVTDYLAGAEAKDLEWQAKVQWLVDALREAHNQFLNFANASTADMGDDLDTLDDCRVMHIDWTKSRSRFLEEKLVKTLTQFASGQPAQGVMSDEDFMREVKRMAETNVVIKTLLDHNGHPDKWPFQLREDLFRRMGLEQKKVYAPIKGIGKDGG